MADGTYERRGPREAELKRFQRLIDAARGDAEPRRAPSAAASEGLRTRRAIVAFGSNVEPRRETIARALELLAALPGTRLVRTSSIAETEPVDVPSEFRDLRFLNGVAVLETTLEALDFSRRMHGIEDALGRVRSVRNGPRTIDLDLVDFDGIEMNTPELTLPHPRARERAFVLEPLQELGIQLDGAK